MKNPPDESSALIIMVLLFMFVYAMASSCTN
jgi:hypothetical protein